MKLLLLSLFGLFSAAMAITCTPGTETSPALNGICLSPGEVADDGGNCCAEADIITTTAAGQSTSTTPVPTDSSGNTITTTRSSAITSSTGSTSSGCVDLLNPRTGVSDCPARANLCNDAVYYDVMTQQCPRTCGRCSSSSSTASGSCADLVNPRTGVSDCPSRASLCNNAVYYDVMTQQCPRTCGRCSTSSSTTASSGSCADLVNPRTGVSDCPARANLCNNSVYYDVMTVQCPRTCGRCSSSSTVTGTASTNTASTSTVAGACVDRINPATGVSDCPSRRSLCTNATYRTLMQSQCPRTCGFC